MSKKRPNIIWIQTDEHRTDSLGCYGSKWAETPNLDKLASKGVKFNNAFCQAPICAPSRTSQLTCLYPQETGILTNFVTQQTGFIPQDMVAFPKIFEASGYETINFGKEHVPDDLDVWQKTYRTSHEAKHATIAYLEEGFDEKEYSIIKRPGGTKMIIGGKYPVANEAPTKLLTEKVIDYLNGRESDDPFLLRVSYCEPHTPVLPPEGFFGKYSINDVPVTYYEHEAYCKRSKRDRELADRERMCELSKTEHEQMYLNYMEFVSYVDYNIGLLLNTVENLQLMDDTIIVFSADHGRMLGEWGTGEKCVFDMPSWKVPFIWSWVGHLPEGKIINEACEMIDTGVTLLKLCELDEFIPSSYRGEFLFDKRDKNIAFGQMGYPDFDKTDFSKEAYDNYIKWQDKNPRYNTSLRLAVFKDNYRMDVDWQRDGLVCENDSDYDGNLFDISNDPHEKNNIWGVQAYQKVKKDLLEEIKNWYDGLNKPENVFGL